MGRLWRQPRLFLFSSTSQGRGEGLEMVGGRRLDPPALHHPPIEPLPPPSLLRREPRMNRVGLRALGLQREFTEAIPRHGSTVAPHVVQELLLCGGRAGRSLTPRLWRWLVTVKRREGPWSSSPNFPLDITLSLPPPLSRLLLLRALEVFSPTSATLVASSLLQAPPSMVIQGSGEGCWSAGGGPTRSADCRYSDLGSREALLMMS